MGITAKIITKWVENYLLLLLLILGFGVRLISINQSIWMDEAISAVATKDFSYSGIITDFIKSDTHTPLYYIFLKFWTSVFGYSELALRFPSIIFGLLTMLLVYTIGKLISEKTAVFAVVLTTFSPLLIYYSQEARMYALTTFLVSLCFYFFLKRTWGRFSISLLLLGASDYLPLLILMSLWVTTLFVNNYKAQIKQFALSHIPLAIFFVIWLPIFNFQRNSTLSFLSDNSWWGSLLGESGLKSLALVWVKFLIGRINFSPQVLYAGVVIIVSMVAAVGLIKAIRNYKIVSVYWLWLVIPIMLSFLLSLKIPGFAYFRLVFTFPAFILLLAYGFATAQNGVLLFVLFLIGQIVFSGIYLLNKNFWREDWKTAVPFIESKLKTNEYVYVSYPESFTPYDWYADKPNFVRTFGGDDIEGQSLYTLDYLMDATDPERSNYMRLDDLGYENTEIYNFRGVGQVRQWTKL